MAISKSKRTIEFVLTAKDKTKAAFRKAQTGIERFRKSAAGLASSLGLAFAGGGIISGIKRMATEMDGLAKTASKLGTTTEELSKLRHAAELTGVAANTLDQGLQRMVRRVAEAAQGTGEAKGALQELGLEATELSRLSMEEQFKAIADAMGDIEGQSDKVRLAFKLFDSGGVALLNTLDLGREGLEKFGAEAEKFGSAVSSEAAAAAVEFNDNLTNMQARLDGLTQTIANKLIPNWNEWIDLLSGTPLDLVGDTELVTKELQDISHAIVSIESELDRLRSKPYFGNHSALFGDTQNINAEISELETLLVQHEDHKADIIARSAEKREKERREANERSHNRNMASIRKEEEAAMAAAVKGQESVLKQHEAALSRFRDGAKSVAEEIKNTIEEIRQFGQEQPDVTPFDYLGKTLEADQLINAGDFEAAMAAIREAMALFQEYQQAGKASSADVVLMTARFEQLAKAAQQAQGSKLEKAVERAKSAYQDFKDEIEGKPIEAPVGAAEGSGKVVRDQTQEQILREQPVTVQVGIELENQTWDLGASSPGPGGGPGADVRTESDKRGFRI